MTETKLEPTKENRLEQAIKTILQTDDGIYFFRYLVSELGFLSTSIVQNQNAEVQKDIMIGCEANRKVWLRIRSMIDEDHLFQIEIKDRKVDMQKLDKTIRERKEEWSKQAEHLYNQQMQMWDSRQETTTSNK